MVSESNIYECWLGSARLGSARLGSARPCLPFPRSNRMLAMSSTPLTGNVMLPALGRGGAGRRQGAATRAASCIFNTNVRTSPAQASPVPAPRSPALRYSNLIISRFLCLCAAPAPLVTASHSQCKPLSPHPVRIMKDDGRQPSWTKIRGGTPREASGMRHLIMGKQLSHNK